MREYQVKASKAYAVGLPASTIPLRCGTARPSGPEVGLPIRLAVALHDTSIAMIERHFSRWFTEKPDELVARRRADRHPGGLIAERPRPPLGGGQCLVSPCPGVA